MIAVHGAEARRGHGPGGRFITHAAELGVQLPQVPRVFDRSPGFAVTSRHEHEHGRQRPFHESTNTTSGGQDGGMDVTAVWVTVLSVAYP